MLLITFMKTDFKLIYAAFAAIIFAFCCLMLGVGMIIGKKMGGGNRFYPALFTGFEAGMMGYALFATFFAEENRFAFAIVDIGQVLFVFFILTMFLRKISDTRASAGSLVKKVLISPIILAIVIGIVLGAFGFYRDLSVFPVTGRIEETLNLLGALTQPLICIVIGFELRFRFSNIQRPLTAIFLRLPIMLVSAYAINTLVVDRLLHLDPIFHLAVYTMFLLPPPFVIRYTECDETEKERFWTPCATCHSVTGRIYGSSGGHEVVGPQKKKGRILVKYYTLKYNTRRHVSFPDKQSILCARRNKYSQQRSEINQYNKY